MHGIFLLDHPISFDYTHFIGFLKTATDFVGKSLLKILLDKIHTGG